MFVTGNKQERIGTKKEFAGQSEIAELDTTRRMKRVFILIAAALMMASCAEEPPVLDVSVDSFVIPANGGTYSMTISTNYPWTAACSASWVTLGMTSGEAGASVLKFQVRATDDTSERSSAITITCKTVTKTVTVTQSQKNTVIIEDAVVKVNAEDTVITVNVKHNVEVTVSVRDSIEWVIEVPTKAMESSQYSFKVFGNKLPEARVAYVDFYYAESSVKEILTIIQAGALPNRLSFTHTLSQIKVPSIFFEKQIGTVYWGDGQQDDYSVDATHEYSHEGKYDVVIEAYTNTGVNFGSLSGIEHISLKEF